MVTKRSSHADGKLAGRSRNHALALDPAASAELLDAAAAHYAAGRLDEAARAYQRVETADPDDIRPRYSLAVIDLRQGRADSARRRLRAVIAREPGLFGAQQNLGAACQSLGRWSEAAAAYRSALALRPDAAETGFSLARALTILGRVDEALACYRALLADTAARHRALTRMAVLDPDAIDEDGLAELQRAAWDGAIDAETRTGLLFALGGVLDRQRQDEAAFAAFAAGNRLKLETLAPVGPDAIARAHAAAIDDLKSAFTPAFIARRQGGGISSAAPIFVVGMPRSGSSLIEQILASHRKVQGMGESTALSDVADNRFPYGPDQPGDAAPLRQLAEDYLTAMRARGWTGAPRFVDKTLENHLRVGMIHLMFPKAVVLHSARDPVDTCLACYRQLFASGAETLYDLGQIGAAYVRYRRMMEHWNAVLPGRVIEVSHEALITDPDRQIHWLVTEACGLDWERACLRFHEAEGVVRTASAAQVRQPIFHTSVQRWRRYERHLAPLFEALGPYAPADVAS